MERPYAYDFPVVPASCAGKRAQVLLRNEAAFPLAVQLRGDGVELGVAFSFLNPFFPVVMGIPA